MLPCQVDDPYAGHKELVKKHKGECAYKQHKARKGCIDAEKRSLSNTASMSPERAGVKCSTRHGVEARLKGGPGANR